MQALEAGATYAYGGKHDDGGPSIGRARRWAVILAGGDGTRLKNLTRFICGDDRPTVLSFGRLRYSAGENAKTGRKDFPKLARP